jgi:hypothetical protein
MKKKNTRKKSQLEIVLASQRMQTGQTQQDIADLLGCTPLTYRNRVKHPEKTPLQELAAIICAHYPTDRDAQSAALSLVCSDVLDNYSQNTCFAHN